MNFKILYITKSNSIKIWNPNDLNLVSRPNIYHKFVEKICVSSANLIALTSVNDNNIYIYDADTGFLKYFFYDNARINNIYFSPTGKYLVCHYDNDDTIGITIKIYDCENRRFILSSIHNIQYKISFSPDEKKFIFGHNTTNGKINLKMYHLDKEEYENILEINNFMNSIFSILKWSSCGNYIVGSIGKKLYLWNNKFDVLKEVIFESEQRSCGTINTLIFSPDNKDIVIGFFSGFVKILNIVTDNVIILRDNIDDIKLTNINCIEFTKCEKHMIIGKSNGSIDIWDYENKIIGISFNDLDSNFKNKMDLYGDYIISTGNDRDIVKITVLE
ncbi:hypothetical protein QJ854_gp065 [Moumouvirus goulette]|uniref:Uncharacterized protein n=1 Tax=Moumouvirus goulette TaxID=1247379 RepID=M1PY59_9VIRU|nr:hypothetical protein QJ854_gp065 [Moumouvirus goulette]AGF85717.1 hypothetical protein glt_00914 [Moumouvirus goulette]